MVEIKGLTKYYHVRKKQFLKKPGVIRAVDNFSFSISEGETLGMVGESGSGKTTAARSILRLIEPDAGKIRINNTYVNNLKGEDLRKFRKNMQIVFQDPYSSLNPYMKVGKIVAEPLRIHTNLNKSDVRQRLNELLSLVGLDSEHANRYPVEFSGGQRQRIGIARAIALNPKFVILDEPVSALDVSIQGQILNLLKDLQNKLNLTYLFVAHDLAVVKHISHRIIVVYLGRIIEENSKDGLFKNPLHPYTQNLIKSILGNKPVKHGFQVLAGDIPSPENPPNGCYFSPRCSDAIDICGKVYPSIKVVGKARVACHLF